MIKQLAEDVFGELLETGQGALQQAKQVSPGKIVDKAVEQVSGQKPKQDETPGLEDLKAKKMPDDQLNKMKQDDTTRAKQDIDATRIKLNREIMARYQRMQKQISQASEERNQEYQEKLQKDAQEKQAKITKEEENAKGSAQLPRGPKEEGLGVFAESQKGSKEFGKKVMG